MKRNRNITQEALNEAWRQKQLRGEPGNIVFVDGIAWEHTDLSADEFAKKYNAVPIEDTLFGKLYGWNKSDDNDVCEEKPNSISEEEQNELQEKCRGIKIPDAPPRSEWMTIDECFDDIINSVEKIYRE